ncbi:MAG: pas sensor protein [Sphingomonas bacterium]|uniref:PAS domain S-box protein n=1 Tax=Sphingomonas bacterium TaxID=1895847 RepID=UPI002639F938|nr:PAS domain S-box protein [Sphingomonas bacterium]MDB5703201.1 pas sensor protein [Sphingomonas bacterium]
MAVDLVLASPVAMTVLWGPDLIQLYNASYSAIAGPRHPQALGQPTRECWPEVWDFTAPIYEAVLHGETRSFQGQLLLLARHGVPEEAWFDLAYSPLRDDDGNNAGILVVVTETTRQVLAERKVASEIDRQRRLFEQAPGFICISSGPEHVYVFGNQAYERLIGHRDYIGKTVRAAMPEIEGQGFFELLDKVYATGEPFVAEHLPASIQGSPGGPSEERFVDFVFAPVIDDAGRVSGIITQGHDVTDAYRAREALLDSERRLRDVNAELERRAADRAIIEATSLAREAQLRSILEAAPTAVIVVDDRGMILEFNPAAEYLWGYAAGDVVGRPVSMLTGPEEHERLIAMIARQPLPGEHGAGRAPEAAFVLTRDGRRLAIEVSVGRARTPQGNLVTIFCRDISERMASEQRLSELGAELAHVSRQRVMSELASDLAHELNQPLTAASNFQAAAGMLIKGGESSERVSDLLDMSGEQILRTGEIIRRLRDFLTKRDIEMQSVSLASTVRDAVDLVLFGAAQFNTRVVNLLDPAQDAIFADRIQVQQVLVNLLSNSLEALYETPAGMGEIIIESRACEGGMIEISVSDNGPGLPPRFHEQLYSRFVTTKEGTAMGIGLSISRRIVEAHGGTLVAENRPEGGAVFRFTVSAPRGLEE